MFYVCEQLMLWRVCTPEQYDKYKNVTSTMIIYVHWSKQERRWPPINLSYARRKPSVRYNEIDWTGHFHFVSYSYRLGLPCYLNENKLKMCGISNFSGAGRIEKSVPRDHRLSSLGKPRDAKRRSSGRESLYHLHIVQPKHDVVLSKKINPCSSTSLFFILSKKHLKFFLI